MATNANELDLVQLSGEESSTLVLPCLFVCFVAIICPASFLTFLYQMQAGLEKHLPFICLIKPNITNTMRVNGLKPVRKIVLASYYILVIVIRNPSFFFFGTLKAIISSLSWSSDCQSDLAFFMSPIKYSLSFLFSRVKHRPYYLAIRS